MATIERIYDSMIQDHFERNRQMLLISGPRQVGKTTVAKSLQQEEAYRYFDWDVQEDRIAILQGQRHLSGMIGHEVAQMVVFDELHKYDDWKNFLKGFFDLHPHLRWKILVTGSARLDAFRKGDDSLLGRYFHLQMFPISVAELVWSDFEGKTIREPRPIDNDEWESLLQFGGFPEPFLKSSTRFHRQWSRARQDRLFQEDIRSLGGAFALAKIELLAELVLLNAGSLLNYSSFARTIRASVESVQRWMELLKQLSFCFTLRPWKKNISRSIAKEPKAFVTDWSGVSDPGKRNENFVASSLLKVVEGWNDTGLGVFGLNFIRTKEKREVDFVVTADNSPWILI